MGSARPKPERLADKLLQVRNALGLSQSEMLRRLDVENMIEYHTISKYELGKNEPPLIILLRYARVAGVYVEDLIDDELDLPEKLPGTAHHKGIKHKPTSRSRKR
ncbi:MAG TPA: helix-turn-helix domain-containing protein [Pyrinomonadaceae bacterium]|jgi:transcriptional regulator with XRE-family HTH domain|nr:helix-turn-helix domain-containing protein [Pyrinomonadaceae bacterium]